VTDRPAPPAGAPDAETRPAVADDRVAELEGVVDRLEDQARRAMADLDNSHKRHTRDLEQVRANERANVARQFLPIIDHLELALGHADAKPSSIVDGVRHVLAEAVEVLGRLGFARIDQVGVPFDPAKHEAVSAIDADDVAPGTVVHVVRPGYGEGNRQLRPASVVVSTGQQ
jgi:molecular chaperone GrpE